MSFLLMPFHIFTTITRYCVYLALMLSKGDAVNILYFCKFWKDYHIFANESTGELKNKELALYLKKIPLMFPLKQPKGGIQASFVGPFLNIST